MLSVLLGFIYGTVTVLVTGGSPERFMNLCALKRRDMWDFQIIENGISVKVRATEYKNLRYAAKRSGVHLHITDKKGFPFIMHRHRNRWGLVVGFLLFFVLLFSLCGRIWTIDVQGLNQLNKNEVVTVLEEFGIREGVRKNKFEWATIRQKVLAVCPEISWMSLNPQGTTLHVDISETEKPPEIIDATQPCNIIASHDGKIVEMQINTGQPMVKVGDGVVKGDLLVSGAVEYADGCTVFRHASGKIIAETRHKVSFDIPLIQTHLKRNGKIITRRVLKVFGVSIPLYLGSVQEPYEKETHCWDLTIADTKLPVGIQTANLYITDSVTVNLNVDEALAEGVEKTEQYVEEALPNAEILNILYQHEEKENLVRVTAEIFCKENIISKEKMLIF